MFEKFFGLRENPFAAGHQPKFLYPSREHQEALAHLRFGIENREPFLLITGEVGTGKTTALYDALAEWGPRAVVALITNSALTRSELLEEICLRFGVPIAPGASKPQALVSLERHLLAVHSRGDRAILLLDEAQNLDRDLLEEIRLLSNLEAQGQKLMHIFLVGQPELEEKLSSPQLRQLRQRIAVHYRLRPLTEEESQGYIHHRIAIAGGNAVRIFPSDACAEVFRITHGIPREINTVAAQAMLNAFVDDSPSVLPIHVTSIVTDTDFHSVIRENGEMLPPPPASERHDLGGPRLSERSRSVTHAPREVEGPAGLSSQTPPRPTRPALVPPAPIPRPVPVVPGPIARPSVLQPGPASTAPLGPEAITPLPEPTRTLATTPLSIVRRPDPPPRIPPSLPGTPLAAAFQNVERMREVPRTDEPAPRSNDAQSAPAEPTPPRWQPVWSPPEPRTTVSAPLSPRLREKLDAEDEPEPRRESSAALRWIGWALLLAVLAVATVLLTRFGVIKLPGSEPAPVSNTVPSSPGTQTPPKTETKPGTPPEAGGGASTTPAGSANTKPSGGAGAEPPSSASTKPSGGAGTEPASTANANPVGGTSTSAGEATPVTPAGSPSSPAPNTASPTSARPSSPAGAESSPRPTHAAAATRKPRTGAPAPRSVITPIRYGVAVGSYLIADRARIESDQLATSTGLSVRLLSTSEGGATMTSIVLGTFADENAAENAASDLIQRGLVNEARVVPLPRAKPKPAR